MKSKNTRIIYVRISYKLNSFMNKHSSFYVPIIIKNKFKRRGKKTKANGTRKTWKEQREIDIMQFQRESHNSSSFFFVRFFRVGALIQRRFCKKKIAKSFN